ncbi:uncharacterized protein LOC124258625 isoform X2 [Haliotis rubra]|uniref:uncharacterized protein LOC124258625 isoform X2 n=1 Tax=Haliotis rubra TaxID=36100 RepID=UPI001EE575A6|nr:uncharacterized protein LOC124258625 isoform X2 [Haliotis rubra]
MKWNMLVAVFIALVYEPIKVKTLTPPTEDDTRHLSRGVAGECDSTTPSKVKKCVVESELFKDSELPRNMSTVSTFCSANNGLQKLTACMVDVVNQCIGDEKQSMLVSQLIDKEKYMNGLGQMCNYTSAFVPPTDCPPKLTVDPFYSCVEAAAVDLTNAGHPSNLSVSLDTMCMYFTAYEKCFQDLPSTDCSDVSMFYIKGISGVKYPYCSLSPEKRRQAIDNYQNYVASSAGLVCSVLTITAAFVVSKLV